MVKLSRCARHYQAKKTDDSLLATQLRRLAFHPSRWGYGKLTDYLKHQACTSKHKRIYRISRVLGLNICRKSRKRVPTRVPRPLVKPILAAGFTD